MELLNPFCPSSTYQNADMLQQPPAICKIWGVGHILVRTQMAEVRAFLHIPLHHDEDQGHVLEQVEQVKHLGVMCVYVREHVCVCACVRARARTRVCVCVCV